MRSKTKILKENEIPKAPHFNRMIIETPDLTRIWKYISINWFYMKLLGFRGNYKSAMRRLDSKAIKLTEDVERVKKEILEYNLMKPKGVYQFFSATANGDDTVINGTDVIFRFPRQDKDRFLCLTDYVSPSYTDSIIGLVVTAGREVSQTIDEWNEEGRFKDAFILSSLSIVTAESFAEMIHDDFRKMWGIQDSDVNLITKYVGQRYSFGYSSCPDMEDQKYLWELLNPEEIGVELTESYMMYPEASVSAVVFHHPEAKYFNIGTVESLLNE